MRRLVLAGLVAAGMCVPSSVAAATHPPLRATCSIRGDRPDPVCTPGAVNPDVSQDTIKQTICRSGWTRSIRPPFRWTSALKRRQIREYGYRDTDPTHYEEDHLLPLELGGAPRDERNLWPEPGASPNPKDADENAFRRRVCSGSITLLAAQSAFLARWGPPAR